MPIASPYRYPVRGGSPEHLPWVDVDTGAGFTLDRAYALLHSQVAFNPAVPTWLPKANFIMLMMHEQIVTLRTRYDEADKVVYVTTPAGQTLTFALGAAAGRRALEQFFLEFMPEDFRTAPRLVEARGHQFTDKAAQYAFH